VRTIKKIVITLVSIFLVIAIVIMSMICVVEGGLVFMAPGYRRMDRYLKANINELTYVIDALFELDYESIIIRSIPQHVEDKYNMTMQVSREYLSYETIPIPDDLIGHIESLYKSGVRVISCGCDSVSFSMWSTMSESRGISFSRSELSLDDDSNIIEVKHLSKENWYYYVDNFEKWKAQHPELFR